MHVSLLRAACGRSHLEVALKIYSLGCDQYCRRYWTIILKLLQRYDPHRRLEWSLSPPNMNVGSNVIRLCHLTFCGGFWGSSTFSHSNTNSSNRYGRRRQTGKKGFEMVSLGCLLVGSVWCCRGSWLSSKWLPADGHWPLGISDTSVDKLMATFLA